MGGELKEILEGQQELEHQFNQLNVEGQSIGHQQLRDNARGVHVLSQGKCHHQQDYFMKNNLSPE